LLRSFAEGKHHLAATDLPHTVLRNSFHLDVFQHSNKFRRTTHGCADRRTKHGAFVSREHAARIAASVHARLIQLLGTALARATFFHLRSHRFPRQFI
jgi:hypothetical protein